MCVREKEILKSVKYYLWKTSTDVSFYDKQNSSSKTASSESPTSTGICNVE